jgi:hypothetical protein
MSKKHRRLAKELEFEIKEAAKHYPELADYVILFRYSSINRQSFMLAQPRLRSLIYPKRKRQFEILINKTKFTKNPQFENGRPPSDVIIGWIGHELGHVRDYINRNSINLIWFGILYTTNTKFLKKAEITADKNTVYADMVDYLVISKKFGRNPKYFEQSYIDKLNALYPSVEDVLEWHRLYQLDKTKK